MTTRRQFLGVAGGAMSLAAAPALAQARPVVVCDSYPLAWFAGRLAGDLADIRFPVPAGVDPSFWRPSIAEISAIQTAELIVLNGASFATWTTRTTLPRARTVDTSAGFADAYIATDTVTHSHGADGAHSHSGTASYTWLDFGLATRQADRLAAALGRVLPDAGTQIDANLATLSADLAGLDAAARRIGALAADVPIIASHPRYQYFARAYGLDLSAVNWDAQQVTTDDQWVELDVMIADTRAQVFIWEAEPDVAALTRMTASGLVNVIFPPLARAPETGDFLSVMKRSLDALGRAIERPLPG